MADIALASWALTTEERARDYLRKVTSDRENVLRLLINAASATIEKHTLRRLVSRDYKGADSFKLSGGRASDMRRPQSLTLPEWPITSLYSASYLGYDALSTAVTINIAAARITRGGQIELVNDYFPRGTYNLVVEAQCGYKAGSHDADLAVLEIACLRLLQTMWIDHDQGVGRGDSFSVGGSSVALAQVALTPDVAAMLEPFVRLL